MKIFIIGSGNVASHLARGFIGAQHQITGIYSRDINHAALLAAQINTKVYSQLNRIPSDSDFYIICVSDKAIEEVANTMPLADGIVLHTAGSIDINVLSRFTNFGVFYPLQTFTAQRLIGLTTVPICIEANTERNFQIIGKLAESISNVTYTLTSEQRLQCHLAAVFANNFVNHFYSQAQLLLDAKGIDFDVLKPLIIETANKAIEMGPRNAQTGPAVRSDVNVINRHLSLLNSDHLKNLYRFVSDSIMNKSGEQ